MSEIICELAWDSIRKLPYDENGVKIFEKIFNSMDSDIRIKMDVIGLEDDKLMVKFIYDDSRFDVWEFYTGCEIVMCDSLCYPDEAKEFLEYFVKFN